MKTPSVFSIVGVAAMCLAATGSAWAVGVSDQSTQQQASEKVAPVYATLPAKRLCVCQDPSDPTSLGAVGYLNTALLNFGSYNLVTALCAFNGFDTMDGRVVLTDFCRIFMEMK